MLFSSQAFKRWVSSLKDENICVLMSSKCISMGVVNIVSYDLLSRMTKQMGERLQFRVVIAVCATAHHCVVSPPFCLCPVVGWVTLSQELQDSKIKSCSSYHKGTHCSKLFVVLLFCYLLVSRSRHIADLHSVSSTRLSCDVYACTCVNFCLLLLQITVLSCPLSSCAHVLSCRFLSVC